MRRLIEIISIHNVIITYYFIYIDLMNVTDFAILNFKDYKIVLINLFCNIISFLFS